MGRLNMATLAIDEPFKTAPIASNNRSCCHSLRLPHERRTLRGVSMVSPAGGNYETMKECRVTE